MGRSPRANNIQTSVQVRCQVRRLVGIDQYIAAGSMQMYGLQRLRSLPSLESNAQGGRDLLSNRTNCFHFLFRYCVRLYIYGATTPRWLSLVRYQARAKPALDGLPLDNPR